MIIFGKQIVQFVIANHADLIEEIYLAKEIDRDIFKNLARLNKPILRLDSKKAQSLAHGGNHQGFLAKIKPLTQTPFAQIKKLNKIVVLCGISDVGNIGAIFRSALCLGAEGVIITETNNLKIENLIRASSGAIFEIPFCVVKNPLDCINELKNEGILCIGADMKGENARFYNAPKKFALFMGSEGAGLSQKILKKLDKIISIKMYNGFNSLNVSVALGILLAFLDSI